MITTEFSDFAIKVENVSKIYQLQQPRVLEDGTISHNLKALDSISFEVKKGESIGIIGPNGSGKSTLLKILAGITKPTKGKITIKGHVASILDIGAGFNPELTGRENVFLNGQIQGFSRKEIQSKYEQIVDYSGIVNFIDEPVKNYSNGMYLRLAFSIMAHLDFDVYLFDEVLSVGDSKFSSKIFDFIFSKKNDQRCSILMVSHNNNEIMNYSEKTIEMAEGKLLRFGNTIDVMINNSNGILKSADSYKLTYKESFIKSIELKFYINGNEVREASIEDDIVIKILVKNEKINRIQFAIKLRDMLNNVVFVNSYSDGIFAETLDFKSFILEVSIPKFLLNKGRYFIDLLGINHDLEKIEFKLLNIGNIEINYGNFSNDNLLNSTFGSIRPMLNWKVQQL
jgi:lipopolysaccharide transport system ATP-binding protein